MVKTDKKMELVVKTDREMDARGWRVLLGRGVGLVVAVWRTRARRVRWGGGCGAGVGWAAVAAWSADAWRGRTWRGGG